MNLSNYVKYYARTYGSGRKAVCSQHPRMLPDKAELCTNLCNYCIQAAYDKRTTEKRIEVIELFEGFKCETI